MELQTSSLGRSAEVISHGRSSFISTGDRLEGSDATDGTISKVDCARKESHGRLHSYRPRACGLHVGHRSGGDCRQGCRSLTAVVIISRMGGGGTTAGEYPCTALWPATADARSKTGTAPDTKSGMRYPIRASELDHRRPSVPPPPMRDHLY